MIQYASYSDTGGRAHNEDSVLVQSAGERGLCAVLADGLGGHGGGDRASQAAIRVFADGWQPDATPDELQRLAQTANMQILSMQTPACRMKTTLVALSVSPTRFAYAFAGDSRLYHFGPDGLLWQTRDHSASQIAVLMGQIKPSEIRFHEDRSRIFRALGQENSPGAESGLLTPVPGRNAFLLCSDGFWEYVYEEEMEAALRDASDPGDWISRMRALLEQRVPPDHDNNSAIAVWYENEKKG